MGGHEGSVPETFAPRSRRTDACGLFGGFSRPPIAVWGLGSGGGPRTQGVCPHGIVAHKGERYPGRDGPRRGSRIRPGQPTLSEPSLLKALARAVLHPPRENEGVARRGKQRSGAPAASRSLRIQGARPPPLTHRHFWCKAKSRRGGFADEASKGNFRSGIGLAARHPGCGRRAVVPAVISLPRRFYRLRSMASVWPQPLPGLVQVWSRIEPGATPGAVGCGSLHTLARHHA